MRCTQQDDGTHVSLSAEKSNAYSFSMQQPLLSLSAEKSKAYSFCMQQHLLSLSAEKSNAYSFSMLQHLLARKMMHYDYRYS